MATLEIRKKSASVWVHVPSDNVQYIVSKLYCKTNGDYFRVVEQGGRERARYHYSDITLYDETQGGIAESFSSANALMLRLETLQYIGFDWADGQPIGFQPTIVSPENGQVIMYQDGVWQNMNFDSSQDEFLQISNINVDGNEITLEAGFIWKINGNNYTNVTDWVKQIDYASEGYTRIDIIVAIAANTFIHVQGVESDMIPVAPTVPPDSLLATTVLVTDDTIGQPEIPIIGDHYVKKTKWFEIEEVGDDEPISLLTEDERHFIIKGYSGTGDAHGFTLSYQTNVYHDMIVSIWNKSGDTLPLPHDDTQGGFYFPNGNTYNLPDNSLMTFRLDNNFRLIPISVYPSGDLKEEKINGTRIEMTVSGSVDIDWDAGKVWALTLNGNSTLSNVNLPTGANSKVIELIVTGEFSLALPSNWQANPNNDLYDGTIKNHLVVSCINGNTGNEEIWYTLTNLY